MAVAAFVLVDVIVATSSSSQMEENSESLLIFFMRQQVSASDLEEGVRVRFHLPARTGTVVYIT